MSTECRDCPLRKFALFAEMTEGEVEFMQGFKVGELVVDAGTTLMMEGSNSPQLYTALRGMGLRYKTFENGDRQVLSFVLPGDFIGLQAGVMREMQHSVEATTPMTLCVFDRKALWEMFRDHPERAFDLTWLAAVEEHFLGESLAIVGHMSGLGRIARAFVRLHDRAIATNLSINGEVHLPYKQQDLADALGLSLVHTNKTLKKLREQEVAVWRNGWLKVLSYPRLRALADLNETPQPMVRPLI